MKQHPNQACTTTEQIKPGILANKLTVSRHKETVNKFRFVKLLKRQQDSATTIDSKWLITPPAKPPIGLGFSHQRSQWLQDPLRTGDEKVRKV
jgi:hypothetical protein